MCNNINNLFGLKVVRDISLYLGKWFTGTNCLGG